MPALIHHLLTNPMSGPDIEDRSFEIIDNESLDRCGLDEESWVIVRRMIHTTGDSALAEHVCISADAVSSAIAALRRGAPIYADSNMIRSGLSQARLKAVCADYTPQHVTCHVADPDVAAAAKENGLPRSLYAIRKAKERLNGGIVVFGNAPVALLELNRMIMEDGIRPALVVAMPVGFVHVVESKEELIGLGVPHIAITGRRGGSTLAVATVHALCSLAGVETRAIH